MSLRRLLRFIGIVAIFCSVGPLAMAAVVMLIVVALGAPIVQLLFAVVDLDALRGVLSIAVWLLAFIVVIATLLPSLVAGLIFAVAALYAGLNPIWMAWLAAAVSIAAVILLGAFVQPPESSPLMLPGTQSLPQALSLSAMLAVLAIGPASLCWWLAKPLHRANVTP
ncbi:hypothetical protein BH11PSE4_BH11PSE4_38000 [soil metagenome]